MAGNTVQLGGYHPNVSGALGDLDSGELLNRQHAPMVVKHSGKVVHSAGVGQKLPVKPVFTHFLVTPVTIADHRVSFDDELAVKIEQYPENPVGAGMLRAEI